MSNVIQTLRHDDFTMTLYDDGEVIVTNGWVHEEITIPRHLLVDIAKVLLELAGP